MSIFLASGAFCFAAVTQAGCFPGELRDRHASAVETWQPAPGTPDDEVWSNPDRALGPPDGRTVAVGEESALTLRFFRSIPNANGPDVRIYEIGPDQARAEVAGSTDGIIFATWVQTASGPTTELDLDEIGLPQAAFIRIRGLDTAGREPGFDLDAVEALH